MAGKIELLEDFRQIVKAFSGAGIDHAVVGALALAVHGFPRATTDIDFLIRKEDLERALQAVEPIGYRFRANPMKFKKTDMEVQRVTKVVEDEFVTLDLLLVNDSIRHIWDSRRRIVSGEDVVSVISRAALIEMKATAGRDQDLVDLERLRGGGDG